MSRVAVRLARSQETLWEFVSCFAPSDPGRLGYNVFETDTWERPVDAEVFRKSIGDVMRRHDALRIIFTEIGLDPMISIEEEIDTPVTFVDLSAEPEERRAAIRASILGHERSRAFDLRRGPLWSVSLLRLHETRHVVAVSLFHLIADGWSTGVFLRDLRRAYLARSGTGPALPALRLSYAAAMAPPEHDAAEWRRRADYWRRRLTPLPDTWPYQPAVGGPDQHRPDGGGVDVTAEASIGLPIAPELVGKLHAFARRQRVTPFLLFLAAYRILLGARTGWSRLVIGTATAGREAAGAEDLVGQFTHNIYLASTIEPQTTLTEAVGVVRATMYEAMRHTASFYEIARAVKPDFDAVRPWPFLLLYHSWFQSAAPEIDPRPPDRLHEHRSRTRRPSGTVPNGGGIFDGHSLRMWAKRGEPGLVVRHDRRGAAMNYNPTFYPREAMVETLHGYTTVLTSMLADPHQRIRDLPI